VRVLGADETVFKVKGGEEEEVAVGFVMDAQNGRTLGFEVLLEGDGEAFKEWLPRRHLPVKVRWGASVTSTWHC
jgi:hypothetical protein